jgi:hypothetical protein
MRNLTSILAHVRSKPPSCVSQTLTQQESQSGMSNDYAFSTSFRIGCCCGSVATSILCYPTPVGKDVVILSPLALCCLRCGRVTEFFDTDRHGYDPEVCGDSVTARGSGDRSTYVCTTCSSKVGQSIVTFAFNNASETLGELPPELEGREQDAFDWFTLEFICSACSHRQVVTDFERA